MLRSFAARHTQSMISRSLTSSASAAPLDEYYAWRHQLLASPLICFPGMRDDFLARAWRHTVLALLLARILLVDAALIVLFLAAHLPWLALLSVPVGAGIAYLTAPAPQRLLHVHEDPVFVSSFVRERALLCPAACLSDPRVSDVMLAGEDPAVRQVMLDMHMSFDGTFAQLRALASDVVHAP